MTEVARQKKLRLGPSDPRARRLSMHKEQGLAFIRRAEEVSDLVGDRHCYSLSTRGPRDLDSGWHDQLVAHRVFAERLVHLLTDRRKQFLPTAVVQVLQ